MSNVERNRLDFDPDRESELRAQLLPCRRFFYQQIFLPNLSEGSNAERKYTYNMHNLLHGWLLNLSLRIIDAVHIANKKLPTVKPDLLSWQIDQ